MSPSRFPALLLCFALPLHAAPIHDGAKSSTPQLPLAPVTIPLDQAALETFPREAVTARAHGKSLRCEGVSLTALLQAAKAMPVEPLRGEHLARYVLVTARDGYRAVYSLAELDPALGNNKVFLVDRCDGKLLTDDDGPLRVIAPDESRPARWLRQVVSIDVIAAP